MSGSGGAMENLVGSPESSSSRSSSEAGPQLKPKSALARLRASFGSITRTQCAVMSLCYLCYGVSYLTYEPFILLKEQLQTSLELSTALLSSYDTLYMASFSTCMFLAGAMIDRVGSKALLVASLAGSSCVVFGFALASAGSWFLAPLWFLNGAIQAISYPGCLAILLPHFSAGVRGTVVGIWYSSTLVGQVSSSIMTAYADSIGATWRQVFYVGSGVSFISALLLLFFLPATHVKEASYTPLRRDSDPDLSVNLGGASAVISSGAAVPEYEETTTATTTADGSESVVVSFRPLASGSPQRKPSAGGAVVPVNLAAASDGAYNTVTRPAAVATPVRVDSNGDEVRPEGMRESLLSGDSAKSDDPSFGSTYVPTAACCGKPHDSLTVCPQSPPAKDSAGAPETKPLSYRQIIAMPGVFRISISYLFAKVANYSLCAWLPYMLNRHLGYSEGTAAGFATVYQTGLAVGCSFFGIMADKYFPGREVLAARYIIGLGIVFYALYAFFGPQAYWVNAVILFPLSASLGGADVLISSTVPYRVADREGFSAQAATLTGIINGFGCVGGVAQGVWAAYWMDEGWQPYLWSLTGYYVLAFFIPWGIK